VQKHVDVVVWGECPARGRVNWTRMKASGLLGWSRPSLPSAPKPTSRKYRWGGTQQMHKNDGTTIPAPTSWLSIVAGCEDSAVSPFLCLRSLSHLPGKKQSKFPITLVSGWLFLSSLATEHQSDQGPKSQPRAGGMSLAVESPFSKFKPQYHQIN
jgi:hypothetical protein